MQNQKPECRNIVSQIPDNKIINNMHTSPKKEYARCLRPRFLPVLRLCACGGSRSYIYGSLKNGLHRREKERERERERKREARECDLVLEVFCTLALSLFSTMALREKEEEVERKDHEELFKASSFFHT